MVQFCFFKNNMLGINIETNSIYLYKRYPKCMQISQNTPYDQNDKLYM